MAIIKMSRCSCFQSMLLQQTIPAVSITGPAVVAAVHAAVTGFIALPNSYKVCQVFAAFGFHLLQAFILASDSLRRL